MALTAQQRRKVQRRLERIFSRIGLPVPIDRTQLRDMIADLDDYEDTQDSARSAAISSVARTMPSRLIRLVVREIIEERST